MRRILPLLLLAACTSRAKEGGVTVLSFEPQGFVEDTRPIEVKLSEAPRGDLLLSISPPLEGRYRWVAQDTLQFIPKAPFSESTRYRVKVPGSENEFTFHTKMFGLASLETFYQAVPDGLKGRVNVELTHPVTPEAARASIRFSDGSRSVEAKLESERPGRVMRFSLAPAPSDSELFVEIDGSLGAASGGEPIGKTVVRSLRPEESEELRVDAIEATQAGTELGISVRFTSDVDASALERMISVSPAVEMRFSEAYHGVSAYGAFKPRTSYTVTVKSGLVARAGQPLAGDVTHTIEMPDLGPVIRFPDHGLVLLSSGNRQITVETVNVKRLGIEVSKIFENNLVHVVPRLDRPSFSETMGRRVFETALEVQDRPNERVRTTISFDDFSSSSRRSGLYSIEVRDADEQWNSEHKWALATDLGISAKLGPEQARVQVLSLATLEPIAGAEVELLSSTNATLAKLNTDAQGVAALKSRFDEGVSLVIARHRGDVSYLPIAGTELPTSDFDVGGARETSAGFEAFAYTDRGSYRPGDTVHLTAILRDRALRTPPAFSFLVELRDPSWRTFRVLKGAATIDGAQTFDVPIPRDAPTGAWTARIVGTGEDVFGEASFEVEEPLPERMTVEIAALDEAAKIGAPVAFRARAKYLFGPPAAGLDVELACRFEEVPFRAPSFEAFSFNARGEDVRSETRELGRFQLDAEGKIDRSCALEGGRVALGPVRVSLQAKVLEKGGRSVAGAASVMLHPLPHYVGARRNSERYHVDEGSDAALEIVVVDPDGRPIPALPVTATVYELDWRTREENAVEHLAVTSGAEPVALPYVPKRGGRYRVEVETPGGSRSSTSFYAGGKNGPPSHPDRLVISPDRARYDVGQTATVMIRAPFSDGKLLLTVERDRVLWQGTAEVKGDTATIDVPIGEAMSPNAYLVAQVVRRSDAVEIGAPMRAFGAVPLEVTSRRHALEVKLEAPAEIRPRQKLEIRVSGIGALRSPHFTVAAIDEGLLAIDRFEAPDPFAFYTRTRRLSLTTHDLYGLVLPDVEHPAKKLDGSRGDPFRARTFDPFTARRVKPVALWSGIVAAGPDGSARIELDVPELSGTLRVMAVGFAGDRFGSATARVRVSDPVVVMPALPRFAGTLDRFRVPVQVFNGTQSTLQVGLTVTTEGSLRVEGSAEGAVSVEPGGSSLATFELAAGEVPGDAKFLVRGTSGLGDTSTVTAEISIRPSGSTVVYSEHQIARSTKPVRFKLPDGFTPGSIRARLELGANPAFRFGESLEWLLRYPHGCVEQTTARAFPLLVLPSLGRLAGRDFVPKGDNVREHFVSAGIGRMLGMMMPSGGLSYWPGQSWGHPWTTVFGAHFLVEAQRAGFVVDAEAREKLLSHVGLIGAGTVAGEYREPIDFRTRAYALYVLALAGRKNAGGLNHLADRFERAIVEEDPEVPIDNEVRLLLAGGLAQTGLWERANRVLGQDLVATSGAERRGFFSSTRADALALSILADSWPDHQSIPTLLDVLANRASDGRWATTQENAFALLAMGKLNGKPGAQKSFWGQVTIDGKVVKRFENAPFQLEGVGPEWAGKNIEISLTGAGKAYVGFRVSGIKADTLPPAVSDGLQIERRHLRPDGTPITGGVERGALVITELTVRAQEGAPLTNVAVIDPLPAGLEIESPRLVEEPHGLEWLAGTAPADFTDVRHDRIVFYTDLGSGETRRFFHSSRAVTVGKYTLPHARAEAMYDPAIRALGGGGHFEVREP